MTVGVAPTNSVYSQMLIRMAQKALRLESRSLSATLYSAAPMIEIFQPENQ
jgi:hypothetical protein